MLIGVGLSQSINAEAQTYYDKALGARDLSQKASLLEKAVALDPDFVNAIYQLGVTYFQTAKYEQAIDMLNRANDLEPTLTQEPTPYLRNAYTFFAKELIEQERFESAIAMAQAAVTLDRNYASAYAALGAAHFGLREWRRAVQALEKAVSIDGYQEKVWDQLGEAYLYTEDYQKSIEACQKALSLNPDLGKAKRHLSVARDRNVPARWLDRAEIRREKGELEQAIELLRTAAQVHPEHQGIADALREAESEYDYQLAEQAIASRDSARAREILESLDPDYKDTARLLAALQGRSQVQEDLITVADEPPPLQSQVPEVAEAAGKADVPKQKETPQPVASEPASSPVAQGSDSAPKKPENRPKRKEPVTQKPTPKPETTIGIATETAKPDTVAAMSPRSSTTESEPVETAAIGKTAQKTAFSKTAYFWIVGIVFGALAVSLVFFKLRSERTPQAERTIPDAPESTSDEEVFKDEVASVTPVTFDSLDPSEILDEDEPADSDEEADLLKDTQTILGSIKKVKRIGRYVVEKEIGRGSMGLIYKAWDPKLDRTVVIKQVAFDLANSRHERARLKDRLFREARVAGRLNHENIVTIYDVDEEDDFSYIVMEYLEGEDLKSRLERGEKFDLMRTIGILIQVCRALEFAHENGIVHRDIKPSNIMLTRKNKVKVADFGIAKLANLGTLTQTGSIVGTPFYMSPEQIEGRKLDGRSDIFSVGVILYEMVTSEHPFAGDNISTVVYKIVHKVPKPPTVLKKGLPGLTDVIVERACAKDVKHRYGGVSELLQDLRKLEDELA